VRVGGSERYGNGTIPLRRRLNKGKLDEGKEYLKELLLLGFTIGWKVWIREKIRAARTGQRIAHKGGAKIFVRKKAAQKRS